jgi:hypothetical protein
VSDVVFELQLPCPTEVIAATLNTYAVPAVSPAYTYDVEVEPVRICVEKFDPPSTEN